MRLPSTLPFMRFIFRQFVLTFPFLASAPKDFFPQKLQPFIASVLARNLSAASPFDEDAEQTEKATREKILSKIQKQFALLLGSATKLVEPEEVVRLSQRDLERLETLACRRQGRGQRHVRGQHRRHSHHCRQGPCPQQSARSACLRALLSLCF